MPLEKSIIDHILTIYTPEVILLGGSRAKNTHRAGSDWDIYLVGNYTVENEQVSENFMGEHLDIALFPTNCLEKRVLRLFYGPVSSLRVLHDNEGHLGAEIVESTSAAYLEKPTPLSSEQKQEKQNYLSRILSKIEAYKHLPEAGYFHLAHFYQTAIPFWFEFHGEWSVPVQYAIPIIQSRDPQYYDILKSITETHDIQEHIKCCEKIIACLQ